MPRKQKFDKTQNLAGQVRNKSEERIPGTKINMTSLRGFWEDPKKKFPNKPISQERKPNAQAIG